MRYLVTLTPLEPYLFGGDTTFGKHGSKEEGSYIVKSTLFPQQSALLGMVKKEMMIQAGYLTRKRKGEWVDKGKAKENAEKLVGKEKFDISKKDKQDFQAIKNISPIFLIRENIRFIKKVDIDSYNYIDGGLENYTAKDDIYDNFISLDSDEKIKISDIFLEVEQVGNKKGGGDNSLFKKISYSLDDNFKFAFYLDSGYELKESIVTLGADRSSFKMEVVQKDDSLEYKDKNDYLVLLGDAYITEPVECDFAITSEISYRQIEGKRSSMTTKDEKEKNQQNNPFQKSKRVFLYERGSVFIGNDLSQLIKSLDNPNLQQIGYNIHTHLAQQGEQK
jgi:CRISPR-associated protein Cmr3